MVRLIECLYTLKFKIKGYEMKCKYIGKFDLESITINGEEIIALIDQNDKKAPQCKIMGYIMKWLKIKNFGGGYSYELMNAIEGMYTIAKFNRCEKTDKERAGADFMIARYFKKLDEWELPFILQNRILVHAYGDKTAGFPTFAITKILDDYKIKKDNK